MVAATLSATRRPFSTAALRIRLATAHDRPKVVNIAETSMGHYRAGIDDRSPHPFMPGSCPLKASA